MAYGNSNNPLPINASQTSSFASSFLIVIYLFIYFCNNMRTALAWLKNKEEFVLGP